MVDVNEINGSVQVTMTPLMNLIFFDDTTSRFVNGPRSRGLDLASPENTSQHEGEEDESDEKKDKKSDNERDEESDGGGDEESSEGYGEGNDGKDDYDWGSGHRESLFPQSGNMGNYVAAVILISFFDSAMDEYLEGTKSGVLPNEILTAIMECSDHQTYLSLAGASASCRDLYYRKFRLNDDYAVIQQQNQENELSSITLENLESGERTSATLGLMESGVSQAVTRMSPIIGVTDPNRMSILDACSLHLSKIPLKHPPYPQTIDMPAQ
ncbi:hypothetical protein BJY00DRAFT_143282 [Aspergillus carlsbadensis]|nr:hypothetical protein BJY00DRAFT_143282 [Aspergillus carlsbadensis]